ncbi:MAG: hydrogenase iron-sulfur subunit [Desulfotignum sp.]|nr:hydrogenase iron-sulfur subunit [Desulfotignum sp.]MCF8136595.1 hydrogenase iron-sulfur subunit [Desulfotignum sp.]
MRLKIPTNFRIIRVPCTGKVDIIHILRAFEKGADGVYVVGCMEGDCHFNEGNFRARKRVEQAARVLEKIGVGKDRVRMYNLSSGEGPLFAQYSTEMVNRVKEMGPSPIRLARQQMAKKADAA